MKRALSVIFSCLILATAACAQGAVKTVKDLDQDIYDLEYAGMNIDTVDNDMSLYLVWKSEEKEEWRQATVDNIKRLDQIRTYLLGLDLNSQTAPIRDDLLASVEGYKKIYAGMETKDRDAIDEEYLSLYGGPVEDYRSKLRLKSDEVIGIEKLSKQLFAENFDLKKIEAQAISDPDDKQEYWEACGLMEQGKFKEAYCILKALNEKYIFSPAQYPIWLKMADCFANYDSNLNEEVEESIKPVPLELYSRIIDSHEYSPVLQDAFIRWRTEYQFQNYGVSNFSDIPNDLYNEKRWSLVKLIQKHLEKNLGDLWAKWQILLLMDIPNIHRGGPFGNTNINHASALFSNETE